MVRPSRATKKIIRPRLRVICGADYARGPGKVDLLALIAETGPQAEAVRGRSRGGGAVLTQTGRRVLALFQRMEKSCLESADEDGREV